MSKKTDVKTDAKAEDKALVTTTEPTMTKTDLFAALLTVGVKPAAKTKKEDLEKLYEENKARIELVARAPELQKECLIKSFGDHGKSALCKKCAKKQKAVYDDCGLFSGIKAVTKETTKRIKKMGHRTGTDIWGTRKGVTNNKFCKALLSAGDAGLSMAEARKAKWNPGKYGFKETSDRLLRENLIELRDGRFYVTDAGYAQAGVEKPKTKAA